MTKEEFIEKAKKIHGDIYDYSLVDVYKNNRQKIKIKCKQCGIIFEQRVVNHLQGQGCKICGRKRANKSNSSTKEEFIEKSIKIHGDKFNYDLVEYINSKTKVKIKCNKCNSIFEQVPSMHLAGNGCSVCNPPHKKLTQEEFVGRLSKTHPNLEVLSQYNGKDRKITVRCKIHDYIYETTPHRLVGGANCIHCYNDRRGETIKNDINKIKNEINKIHGDKYQYPYLEQEYKTNKSKITIICPKHGKFQQSYNKHVNQQQGCPSCSESHNEKFIVEYLTNKLIKFEREKKFSWLGNQSLDFYLSEYNIGLEIQGEFHFSDITINGNFIDSKKQIERDERKKRICEENGIDLLYLIPIKLINKIKVSNIYNISNIIVIDKNKNLINYSKDKPLVNEKLEKIKKILL